MKVGVFDSGIGGLKISQSIAEALDDIEVIYVNDHEHLPYGDKPTEQIHGYVLPILEDLITKGCEAIVIACNTVTTTLITRLRSELRVPLIGIEPMIKPASQATESKVIAVCATPSTLASERYAWLKQQYAQGVTVLEPDCSDWAYMIENSQVDHAKIKNLITDALDKKADVIVLGCTHYHWIEEEIRDLVSSKAEVIQPEEAVIRQLKRVIEQLR